MSSRRVVVALPVVLACAAATAWAVLQPQGQVAEPAAPQAQPQAPTGAGMGDMLIRGLQETEGCLGVDAAQFRSGKNSIIAWFENAEAARAWYKHPTHMQMLRMTGTDPEARRPLEHVADDTPVMVIATLTFTDSPKIPGIPIPIDQISIELYAPLPGGAMVNGRLAPEGFKVEHMRNLSGTPGADQGE